MPLRLHLPPRRDRSSFPIRPKTSAITGEKQGPRINHLLAGMVPSRDLEPTHFVPALHAPTDLLDLARQRAERTNDCGRRGSSHVRRHIEHILGVVPTIAERFT